MKKILTKENIIKLGLSRDIKFNEYKNDSMYTIGLRGTHGYFVDFIISFYDKGFSICIEMSSMKVLCK